MLLIDFYWHYVLSNFSRDFRLVVRDPKTGGKLPHPVLWYSSTAKQNSPTEYEAEFMRPVNGWTAFFIQVSGASAAGRSDWLNMGRYNSRFNTV